MAGEEREQGKEVVEKVKCIFVRRWHLEVVMVFRVLAANPRNPSTPPLASSSHAPSRPSISLLRTEHVVAIVWPARGRNVQSL